MFSINLLEMSAIQMTNVGQIYAEEMFVLQKQTLVKIAPQLLIVRLDHSAIQQAWFVKTFLKRIKLVLKHRLLLKLVDLEAFALTQNALLCLVFQSERIYRRQTHLTLFSYAQLVMQHLGFMVLQFFTVQIHLSLMKMLLKVSPHLFNVSLQIT